MTVEGTGLLGAVRSSASEGASPPSPPHPDREAASIKTVGRNRCDILFVGFMTFSVYCVFLYLILPLYGGVCKFFLERRVRE